MSHDPGAIHRFLYYKLDPELRIIHLFSDCRGLKMAKKWGYMKEYHMQTPEDAGYLDFLVQYENYVCCHSCWAREKAYAVRQGRLPRFGFRREPPQR